MFVILMGVPDYLFSFEDSHYVCDFEGCPGLMAGCFARRKVPFFLFEDSHHCRNFDGCPRLLRCV